MSKKIAMLVVDADPDFRESVANLLLLCGVEKYELAANAEEAIKKMSNTIFDIIFVDLFMPEMTGLQLARELNEKAPKARIFLVIEDQHQLLFNNAKPEDVKFPTILKSFVNNTLPELVSEKI